MTAKLTLFALALSFGTAASASTYRLVDANAEQMLFVEDLHDASADARWVLRDHQIPQSLGGSYAHRSQRLRYRFDCAAGELAVTDWTFYAGNLGHGEVVWADKMNDVAFYRPSANTPEARLVAQVCS